MPALFDELQQKSTELKITPKGAKVLTKNQVDFNKIIARIKTLEKQLISEEQKLANLLAFYNEKIPAKNKEVAELKIEFAFLLNRSSKENKFSNKQITDIKEIINTLMDDAFCHLEPTKEQEELYNSWSEFTYQEEKEAQMKMEKEMFTGFVNSMFGVDLDMENVDMDDAESFAAFEAKMKSKILEKIENEGPPKGFKTSKKNKKITEKENLLKAEEELKNKNLRSIYISLTKVLHPDAEMNADLKKEKEEIMKKVTSAYEEKDLPTLLKLELEWVHKTTEHLDTISEDKLKSYVSVLRNRAKELEAEKFQLLRHPKFEPIWEISARNEKDGRRLIESDKTTLEAIKKNFKRNLNMFKSLKSKKDIVGFISGMHEDLVDDDEDNDFDFELPF